MHRRLFESTSHAALYAKFRPKPPPKLISFIIEYLKEKLPTPFKHAVDVGCGTGQSTTKLCPYFDQVIGVDISKAQVESAIKENKFPNVLYRTGTFENLGLPPDSVTLVTASQAFHWFDKDAFFREAQRVLIPNGGIALCGYKLPVLFREDCSQELGNLVNKIYHDLDPYWTPERKLVDSGYQDITLPFDSFQRHTFIRENKQTAADFIGYLLTWSAFQKLKAHNSDQADKFITDFQQRFLDIVQADSALDKIDVIVRIEHFLLIGRKTSSE